MTERTCVNLDILSSPSIDKKPGNCGAGIIVPPQPPPPANRQCRKIVAYEKPDSKLISFRDGSYGEFQTKYYEPGINDDSLWGEPLFLILIPNEAERGDKIFTGGGHVTPTPGKGNPIPPPVGLGAPFPRNGMFYIQLGFRPVNYWAPVENSPLFFPDSIFFHVPQVWRSLAPIQIQSWRPFAAEACLTNTVEKYPIYTQHNGLFLSDRTPGFFASPDYGLFAGQKLHIVFKEVAGLVPNCFGPSGGDYYDLNPAQNNPLPPLRPEEPQV